MRKAKPKVLITPDNTGSSRVFDALLLAGIGVRFLVFLFLNPFNCDGRGHLEHILYFKQHWLMPPGGLGHETWQPPLYYLLSAGLALFSESAKFLQSFSFITSIATLYVARQLVNSSTFLKRQEGKVLAFSIICLLPQFVMFSLYLSNDSLAIFLGCLSFCQADRFLNSSTTRRFLELMGILTLGLLTKGQFLVITCVLFPWACLRYWTAQRPPLNKIILTFSVAMVLLGIGCVKYVQNTVLYKKPFVSNLDFNPGWLKEQQGAYQGLTSIFDINVFKLWRKPTLDESTLHSIPLMLYGTFWYQYIPESNFQGNLAAGASYVGRYQDAVGVLPAMMLIVGAFSVARKLVRTVRSRTFHIPLEGILRLCAASAFVGNIALLLYELLLFDNWSMLQARLLFPTLLGGLVLCDAGIATVAREAGISRVFRCWQMAFTIGSASYFVVEVTLQLSSTVSRF